MSSTLNIRVADELREALSNRATECGYSNVEEYVEALVRSDAERIEYGVPDRVKADNPSQLAVLVREGIKSPAREMRSEDWRGIREQLINDHRQHKNG